MELLPEGCGKSSRSVSSRNTEVTLQGAFPHSPFSFCFVWKRIVPVEDLAAGKLTRHELRLNDDHSDESERVEKTVHSGWNTSTSEGFLSNSETEER